MQARNRAYDVGCGEGEIIFAATGGPAFAHDCDRGKRPGNFADMVDYLKLVQQLNVIHQEGGCPIEPTDLPADNRHLDFYQAALTLTDKTWQCWALGEYRVEDAINMAGIAYGLGRDGDEGDAGHPHHHQFQLAAAARYPDVRGAAGDGPRRPAGGDDALHALRRHEPGDPGRRAGAAACRGAGHAGAVADRTRRARR